MVRIRIGLALFGLVGLASANLFPVIPFPVPYGDVPGVCGSDWECEAQHGAPDDEAVPMAALD